MASRGILLDSLIDGDDLSKSMDMDSAFKDFDFGAGDLLQSAFDDDSLSLDNLDTSLWNTDELLFSEFDSMLEPENDTSLDITGSNEIDDCPEVEAKNCMKTDELICTGSPVNEVEISSESTYFSSEYSGDNSGSDSDTTTSSINTVKIPTPPVQPQRITKVIKKISAPQRIAPKPIVSKYYKIQPAQTVTNGSVKTVRQIIVPKPIGKVKDPNTMRIIRSAAQIIPALTNVVTTFVPQAVTQTLTTLQSPMQFFVTPSSATTTPATSSTEKLTSSGGSFRLSDEERRLLAKEGIYISDKRPLSKAEERELKRIRRKIRNKVSAQDSRKRKKEYIDQLEDQVKECNLEKDQLAKRINQLESQNKTLAIQLRKLQSLLTGSNGKPTQTSTCMLVLMLSMALLLAPNMKSEKETTSLAEAGLELEMPAGVRSRTLLQNTLLDSLSSVTSDEDFDLFSSEEDSAEEGDEVAVGGPFKRRLLELMDHDYVAPYPPRKRRSRTKGSFVDAVEKLRYESSSDSGLDSPDFPGSPAGGGQVIEDGVVDSEPMLFELFKRRNRTEQQRSIVIRMPIDEAYLG